MAESSCVDFVFYDGSPAGNLPGRKMDVWLCMVLFLLLAEVHLVAFSGNIRAPIWRI